MIKYWFYSLFLAIAIYIVVGFLAGYPDWKFSVGTILGMFLVIGFLGWEDKR